MNKQLDYKRTLGTSFCVSGLALNHPWQIDVQLVNLNYAKIDENNKKLLELESRVLDELYKNKETQMRGEVSVNSRKESSQRQITVSKS